MRNKSKRKMATNSQWPNTAKKNARKTAKIWLANRESKRKK